MFDARKKNPNEILRQFGVGAIEMLTRTECCAEHHLHSITSIIFILFFFPHSHLFTVFILLNSLKAEDGYTTKFFLFFQLCFCASLTGTHTHTHHPHFELLRMQMQYA